MLITNVDVRELDRRAVRQSMDIVARLRPENLQLPTPCAGWRVIDLLAHMTAQHRGFAAAARGFGADLAVWSSDADPDLDPVAAYLDSARDVLAAFAAADMLSRTFALPEISTAIAFPAAQAIGFHLVDYVVHGWDVARALGEDYLLDDDVSQAALRIARAVPDGPERLGAGSAFAPGLSSPDDASALELTLRALGRSPSWPVTAL